MFAYVKYRAKCPRHAEKKIVPVSEIRNFDSQNIGNRNKSYNIKCGESYCAAIVIFTDDTEKAVEAKISVKRQILPPKDLIESASDLNIPVSRAKQQATREKNGEQVKKLLSKKLDALQNKAPRKATKYAAAGRNKTSTGNVNNKRTINILQDRTNAAEERHAVKRKHPSLSNNEEGSNRACKNSADKLTVGSTPKKAKPNSYDNRDIENLPTAGPGKSSTSKIRKGKTSGVTLGNVPDKRGNEHSCSAGLGKGDSTSKVTHTETSNVSIARDTRFTESSRAIVLKKSSALNITQGKNSGEAPQPNKYSECNDAKFRKLTDELRCLKAKCSKYEDTITEQKVMINDLTHLNIELQREVLEYFGEFKAMAKQYEGAIRNLEGADTPPIGYTKKSSNTVHLGHNVWIEKSKYEDVACRAKTYQLFVKGMAVAVFGFQVLETSSVTGARSNKFPDRPAKPKLDGTKILAIHDIFKHWLQTEKKMTAYEAHVEASKTRLYISRKISDLNRPPAGNDKKRSSAKDTEKVHDPVEVDNESDGLEELYDEMYDLIRVDNEMHDPETVQDEIINLEEDYDGDNDPSKQVDHDMDDPGESDGQLDQEVDREPEIKSNKSNPKKETSETLCDVESAESEPDQAEEDHDEENEESTETEEAAEEMEEDE